MKQFVPALLLTGIANGVPAAVAEPQEDQPWYASASATLSRLESTEGTIANAPVAGSTVRTQNSFKAGGGGQIAFGRRFSWLRLETELGYTQNEQESYVAVVPPTGSIPADVKEKESRAMVNVYRDLSTGALQPYVGVGVGATRVEVDFFAPRAPFPAEPPRQLIKDDDTRFAYQIIGGLAMRATTALTLSVQYRWLDAGTIEGLDVRGQIFKRDHAGHHLDLGLRIGF